MKRKDFKAAFRETVMTFITFTFSVIIVLPYLLSVSSDTSEPVMRLNFYGQSIINIVSFWLPMPVILAGLVVSYKKLSRMVFWFLSVAASICFGLSVFTRVALDNSEKFTFILSFFYAIYFVLAISSLLHLISKQWVKRTLSTCILIFLLITPVITEAAYIVSPWFRDNTYAFSGRHVLFSRDEERNDAYTWIRKNTPAEALLMLSYMETSEPDMIAQNSTYEPAALSERNLFVVKDWYTVSNPEFRKRVKIREKLFANYSDHEVRDFFRSLNSPVYLLVEDQLPPIYLTDKIFHDFPEDTEGFTLVFSNERQKVYQIRE